MNVIWKSIEIDNKIVFVSSLGDIKYKNKIKNKYNHPNGYLQVSISDKNYLVHRLVALAFIENTHNKKCVNHIDCNKINNSVNNLEWCTYAENMAHAVKNGLQTSPAYYKNKKGYLHNKSKEVVQFDSKLNVINVYGSIGEASRNTNISIATIFQGCSLQKLRKGFYWLYTSDVQLNKINEEMILKSFRSEIAKYNN